MTTTAMPSQKAPAWFWILALFIVVYVAACTGQRENQLGADAWEHMRVLRALIENLWHPGNPTFANDLPSVRYSPYLVGLALLCRSTGLNAYDALSIGAVVNTSLLVVGVWLLLAAFEEVAAAGAVLLVMISLWGAAPGFANSYAFSDLPWVQVNPSAFSFALVLLSWALLRRMALHGWNVFQIVCLILLVSTSSLDHGMTGLLGIMGLSLTALLTPPDRRRSTVIIVAFVVMCGALLCLAWPWYSFLAALTTHQDVAFWFNPYISKVAFTVWCAPAVLFSIFTIPLRDRPLVRLCLLAAVLSLLAGLGALLIHSPVLARLPIPGTIFLHVAIGIFAYRTQIFKPSSWPDRLRGLMASSSEAAYPMLQVTVAVAVLFFLAPQILDSATQPYLGRAYLARILHLRDLQRPIRQNYLDLLSPVGLHDVVLSDPETSSVIPAFRGRVVAASHYELFVPGQTARVQTANLFFAAGTSERQREDIIRTYQASWIVLNPTSLSDETIRSLKRDSAIVRQTNGMILMRASAWIAAAPPVASN